MGGQDTLLDNIIQLKIQLRDMMLQHYFISELFHWVWWFEVAIIVISLVIWWRVTDKKRLLEICLCGLLVNLFASFLDVLGTDFVLWEYPIHVLPKVPLLLPIDYTVVPIIDMIIYQKFPRWGKYLLVSTITAAVLAFVFEPLAIKIGMYTLITWRFIYSFPIYILINICAKFSTEYFISKQADSEKK